MANNNIKVQCAKCGKEFELDEKWQGFAEKYPERITCFECKSGAKKDIATAYKNTPKKLLQIRIKRLHHQLVQIRK